MKKNRTFSSLKPIRSLIPDNIKKIIKNTPTTDISNLKRSWEKILGKELSNKCTLLKVQKNNSENSLFLKVDRSDLIDIDYSRYEIAEKINSFLGFKYISKILINPHDNKSPQETKKSLNLNKKMENLIDSIQDEDLKEKLKNFNKKNEK